MTTALALEFEHDIKTINVKATEQSASQMARSSTLRPKPEEKTR
jgi:hypothetical protein